MLNRRHLRIKILQVLYAHFQGDGKDALSVEKELWRSIDKMYELYLLMNLIFVELKDHAVDKLEEKKNKIRPTEEDLNPSRKFINNGLIQKMATSTALKKISEERKVNWMGAERQDFIRKLYVKIKDSTVFKDYMRDEESDFEADKKFSASLLKEEIAQFSLLHDFVETESVYWIDDLDLVCSMLIKNIKQTKETDDYIPLTLFRDEEEEKEFIHQLVYGTIGNNEDNSKLIDELTENWELERIAKMDFIILKMAITELVENKTIPVKVTLNEYIEISKFYSTPKSQLFINGILDKAIEQLEKEGKIKKIGKGLVN